MHYDDIIRLLNRHDYSVFGKLGAMLTEAPEETRELIITLFDSTELRDDMSLSIELMRVLVSREGREHVEKRLADEWPHLSRIGRRRVAATFQDSQLLSMQLAEQLFHFLGNDVGDRHAILAGLATNARARQCEQVVVQLLKQVGKYEEAARQDALEQFTRSVVSSFYGCGPQDIEESKRGRS